MKAMRIVEWGKPLELQEIEVPKLSGRGAVVRILASGVCHTDVHLVAGSYDLGEGRKLSMADRGINLPLTLGHEIAGTIESLGSETRAEQSTLKINDPVVVYPWLGCGACRKCRSGMENICENKARTLGIFQDGGYAEYVFVPDERYLVPLGDIDPKHGAPLACSGLTTFSAVKKSRAGPNELVVIIGAGGLGTTAIQIVKKTLGARVVAVDVDNSKLKLAEKIGADLTINSKGLSIKEMTSRIREINHGLLADVAIDFVGMPATSSLGFEVLGRGGRLILVGLFGGEGRFALPIFPLKALEVMGNFTGTIQDLGEMVQLVGRGVITPVVSESFSLDSVNQVIEKLVSGKIEGRAVVEP
ncbi:MAG TPA: alcohol dehydrogenase [Nitrososphaerales archaeon]|nr:alcohol dehydrogenase [Nitrososphaerales archaeon]